MVTDSPPGRNGTDTLTENRPGDITLVEHITSRFGSLTVTEKRVARTLLDNYPVPGLGTVASFASAAGVSAPTVLRLIEKLGFDGYADFQNRLIEELEARLQSPLQRQGDEKSERASHRDHLYRYAEQVCDNVMNSVRHLASTEIESVSRLLMDHKRRVYVVGGRFSNALAQSFYAHLHAVRGNVQNISGQSSAWPEHLVDMRRRDVLIVFDFRRYQKDVVGFAQDASRRGARIVLFTDQWRSPAAKVADHVLSARIDTSSRWDSAVAPLVLVEAITAIVTDRCWPRVESRVRSLESLQTQLHRHGD
jgi:DNA-binding MurR/RpiR family transcriptional regulator